MPKRSFFRWMFFALPFSLFIISSTSGSFDRLRPQTSEVGTIKGDFQVTPAGQANYSMAIDIPPGTAGMTPALSIVYDSTSSNLRNGLLGVGFSLDGLSTITRCSSNQAQNDLIRGVDFTDKDRFCLNGEQLVAIKGDYGADGTEYRTYVDGKAKIISYGHKGNGPASFKVWTKGGQVAEYGLTNDSQVKAEGKEGVGVWALNKIQDTSGNYLEVVYSKDETKGSFYPLEIKYTGNENAKVLPYNSIKFAYEDRPDIRIIYQAGSKNTLDKRLQAIQILQNADLVYTYNITYEISKNTYNSRIVAMQKCAGDGACLPPTRFEWQTNEEGWERAPNFDLPEPLFNDNQPSGQLVDLNGDGLPDFIVHDVKSGNVTKNRVLINTGSGWVDNQEFKLPGPITIDGKPLGEFVDLSGSGFPDFVLSYEKNGNITGKTFFNTGSGWEKEVESLVFIIFGSRFDLPVPIFLYGKPNGQFVDLNGKGLPDFVIHNFKSQGGATTKTWLNTKRGWGQSDFHLKSPIFYDDHPAGQLLDLNGDGLPDLLYSEKNGNQHDSHTWINDGGQDWKVDDLNFHLPVPLHVDHKPQGQFVDINGDGLPDFVVSNEKSVVKGNLVWLNTGSSWQEGKQYHLPEFITDETKDIGLRFVDVSGSGFPAVYKIFGRKNASNRLWLNTGIGWQENEQYRVPIPFTNGEGWDLGVMFVDLNGDGLPDIIQSVSISGQHFKNAYLNKAQKLPDYLIAVTDGLGNKLSIDYEPLSGTKVKVYTKEHNAKYPDMDLQGPMYVVYKTISNTAINDDKVIDNLAAKGKTLEHVTTYHYTGAKLNHLGLGFLGFHQVVSTDESTGISTTITYDQNIKQEIKTLPVKTETKLIDGTLISSSEDVWNLKTFDDFGVNHNYYFPYVAKNIKKTFDLKGVLLSTTTTENILLDEYGNPLMIESTVLEAGTHNTYTTVTENTYRNHPDKWFLGELVAAKVTKSATGKLSQSRTSSFNYDPNTSLLMTTIAEPDDSNLALKTEYQRDVFGNIIATTVSGKGIEDRNTKVKYDEYGRFIIQTTNPLDQTTSQVFDPKFGKVTETTDLNGLKTFYEYDGFGREVLRVEPDESKTVIKYLPAEHSDQYAHRLNLILTKDSGNGPGSVSRMNFPRVNTEIFCASPDGTIFCCGYGGKMSRCNPKEEQLLLDKLTISSGLQQVFRSTSYVINIHKDDGTFEQEFYDTLNRKIATAKESVDGKLIWQLFYYDELGRVSKKTEPFFIGDEICFTEMQYNVLGELTKSTLPDGSTTLIEHNGFTTTENNQVHHKRSKTVNALGELISTKDNLGSVITYQYDAYSNMVSTKDSAGNLSVIKYDNLGRKIGINDPDKGVWSYEYDVIGNLISQKDAMGHVTTFKYDKLNRMISRTDSAGTSTWEYDTAPNGIGELAKVNSLNLQGKGAKEKLESSAKALKEGLKEYTRSYNYDALGRVQDVVTIINNQKYVSSYSYDQHSRVDVETYPNGLKVKNFYNQYGYLTEIRDADTNGLFWRLNAKDARGNVTSESRSNGLTTNYTYDQKTGFLTEIETVLGMGLEAQRRLIPNSTGMTATKEQISKDDPRNLSKARESLDSNLVQKETYKYDNLGNVTAFQDEINNVTESYQYDDLNRLVLATSSARPDQIFRFDALGNITYKSDVGEYKYGKNGIKPHAVTKITGNRSGAFKYDENGDQIEGILNGVKRKITYTSYSKPLTINVFKSEKNEKSNKPNASINFYYNADREKFARVDDMPGKVATTYYLGNYELVVIDKTGKGSSTIIQQKSYIGPNTIHIKTEDVKESKNNRTEVYEMLHNNLDSITDITDENGNVVQHFSYTPFGEQTQTKGATLFHPITYKGFTGHEEVEAEGMNLIHMDGRIYDPVVGRFLSADPYVQEPTNSQSLNRYSYCINNPLAFIDPSGFGFWGSLWRSITENPVVRMVIGVVVGVGLFVASIAFPVLAPYVGAWWQAALVAGGTTAALGVASGVGWQQILFESFGAAAITAGITWGIGAYNAGQLTFSLEATSKGGGSVGAGIVAGLFGGGRGGKDSADDRESHLGDHGFSRAKGRHSSEESHSEYARNSSDRSSGSGNYNNGAGASAYDFMYEQVKHIDWSNVGTFSVDLSHSNRPSWSETWNECFSDLTKDKIFRTMVSLYLPAQPFSKQTARDVFKLTPPNMQISSGGPKVTPKTNLYSVSANYFKWKPLRHLVGRPLAAYGPIAIGSFACGYMGACIYDRKFSQ